MIKLIGNHDQKSITPLSVIGLETTLVKRGSLQEWIPSVQPLVDRGVSMCIVRKKNQFILHTFNSRTKCNSFVDAYEGIAYPTGITAETPIRIYRNVLCRMLELDFHEHRTLDYGPEALVFRISNRTYSNNPDKECLCGDGTCIEGVSDLSPCFYSK